LVQQLNMRRPASLWPSTAMLESVNLTVHGPGTQLVLTDNSDPRVDRFRPRPAR
jgi:hypothetical protein